jgi:hypothetical protein
MGIRFRKRLKIAPGVHLNLSLKRGVSASFGPKGATHNVGLDGRRKTTVGIPGSGLSYSQDSAPAGADEHNGWRVFAVIVLVCVVGLFTLLALR